MALTFIQRPQGVILSDTGIVAEFIEDIPGGVQVFKTDHGLSDGDWVYNYSKTWNGTMAFYQLDKEGSTGDDYALILDEMDELIDKFVNKLNFFSSQSDKVLITFGQQQPFVKATADILTGNVINQNLVDKISLDLLNKFAQQFMSNVVKMFTDGSNNFRAA